MKKKKRFRPTITRVKLNPEQAVLTCACYNLGFSSNSSGSADYLEMGFCSGKGNAFGSGYLVFESGNTLS